MNTTYEHKNELTFIGFHTEITPDEGAQKCPEFWDREFYGKYARLWQTMKPETPVETAILENGIGMYAICADDENGYSYWIAGLYKGGDVPEGLDLFTFPESDWAIFSEKGPLPQSLQSLDTQVWNEWAPNQKATYEIGASFLEIYSAGNPQSPDYEIGMWVPVRERSNMLIETERLIITEFTPDMAQVVQENSLDEDNKRFVPDEVWETVEEAEETLEFLISQYGSFEGPLVYPILVKETKDNIGYVQLCPIDDGKWEVGYHIAKKYTGNGYATEAVKAFLPVIAKQADISEIYGICLAENKASHAVMKKCGFENVFSGTGIYQGAEREIVKNVWRIQAE